MNDSACGLQNGARIAPIQHPIYDILPFNMGHLFYEYPV
jgi:hypothetical protein